MRPCAANRPRTCGSFLTYVVDPQCVDWKDGWQDGIKVERAGACGGVKKNNEYEVQAGLRRGVGVKPPGIVCVLVTNIEVSMDQVGCRFLNAIHGATRHLHALCVMCQRGKKRARPGESAPLTIMSVTQQILLKLFLTHLYLDLHTFTAILKRNNPILILTSVTVRLIRIHQDHPITTPGRPTWVIVLGSSAAVALRRARIRITHDRGSSSENWFTPS
uniref:Uncharacterized protein n=1 Tax=Timema poppense TaxID=170557 RepID=A0A7R9CXI6_TIMPO|nr:unnamed protein product [Timema poppensis]